MKKLGTVWVGHGEGATICILRGAIEARDDEKLNTSTAILRLRQIERNYGPDYKTNLALTGEPLIVYDLRRIVACD